MGLFDLFKKKKTEEPVEESSSPWARRLKNFDDWEDDEKKTACKEFLTDLGNHLENAKVKEKLDFDDVYLRGRYQEVPVMVELDGTAGWVSIDTKCNVPFEDMSLEWDLEKIPVEADDDDDDDDWGDEEEIRVFLAKGVFVEGGKSEVSQVMDAFASLPKDLGDEILTTMQTRRLTRFGIYGDGVHLGFDEDFYEMSDPIAEIIEVLVFTTKIAKILGAAKPVEGSPTKFVIAGATPAAALQLVTCSYCHTKFNIGSNSRCPNCGASYTE